MRDILSIYLLAVLLLFSACSDVYEQDFTPEIRTNPFLLTPVDKIHDSVRELQIIENQLDVLCYDTISVGDTVRFTVLLNARTSVLTSFDFPVLDTTALRVKLITIPEQQCAIADSSNIAQRLIYFNNGYPTASFGVEYVALKSNREDTISMRVRSTSKFSPKSFTFYQPVR